MMPEQKPGRSKQDYGTPREFIDAFEAAFGAIDVDLAAHDQNAKCNVFITSAQNSLVMPWASMFAGKLGWLNPPFARIEPWALKCYTEAAAGTGFRVAMLTPYSVANWYIDHVHGKAAVLALSPRLTFEGETTPYPKDCMLSLFGFGESGYDVWRWKP